MVPPCKCAPLSPTLAPLPQRVAELEGGMLEQPRVRAAMPMVQLWHTVRAPDPVPPAPLRWLSCPVQTSCWSELALYPTLPTLPSMGSPHPRGSELDPAAMRGHLGARGHTGCPVNWPSPGQCLAALQPVPGAGEGGCLRRGVRFPGLLWVPLGSQQLWGRNLLGSSQDCGAQ